MVTIQVETNLMKSQVKPAALRIATVLATQKYDIECAALIGSFLGSCGITQDEINHLTNGVTDQQEVGG